MAKKVLLIDDDSDDRELFCEAMEEIAPEIVCFTASNSRKALAMLDNKEVERPDIIFLDVNMPVVSGWQCLALLKEKEEYKDIPVIMYSTSSYQEDITKAQQLGALCFFSKPRGFKELKKGLEKVAIQLTNDSLSSLTLNSPQLTCS